MSRPAVTEIKGPRPSTADQLLAPLVPRMRAPSTAAAQDNFEGVAAGGKGPLLSSPLVMLRLFETLSTHPISGGICSFSIFIY